LQFKEGFGKQLPQLEELGLTKGEVEVWERSVQNNLFAERIPIQENMVPYHCFFSVLPDGVGKMNAVLAHECRLLLI